MQAKDGRAHILGEMTKALGDVAQRIVGACSAYRDRSRSTSRKSATVIGTGGKVIREIVA